MLDMDESTHCNIYKKKLKPQYVDPLEHLLTTSRKLLATEPLFKDDYLNT